MGDIIPIKRTKFQAPPPSDLSIHRRKVYDALVAAGFTEGRHHRGGGWSDGGSPPYEPAEVGFIIDERRVGYTVTKPDDWISHRAIRQVYIDHGGKGRKQALVKYRDALTAAGFPAEISKMSWHHKKEVVWVPGYFDMLGKAYEGPVDLDAERYKDYGKREE